MTASRRHALAHWFETQGWRPAPFQRDVWRRYLAGESGLLVTPTGSGKTLAAFGGPLLDALRKPTPPAKPISRGSAKPARTRVLWVTPLRALANDTVRALSAPIEALGLDWAVAKRTGDAKSRDKRLVRTGQAEVVVITPESLALHLSYPDADQTLAKLEAIIVDEWHELLGNKRGVLLQLCLARLRKWNPQVRTWGLSATLGNLEEAAQVLLPHCPDSAIITAARPRTVTLETLLPAEAERFPWAGHLGLSQLARVHEKISAVGTSIIFTNTRSQAELWHKALQASWLGAPEAIALHHGSLDAALRLDVEQRLSKGTLRCVVATSSLDLGVDFPAVDQVFQIGSPKGLARLLQRAGRSKHRPGEAGHVICVPSHALEITEYAAAREALKTGRVESREPPVLSLDVLAQHAVTVALGSGFDADELLAEVRTTHAFADLSDAQWHAVLNFIVRGGEALEHYPEFRRVEVLGDRYVVRERKIALRQRLSIGTIASDAQVSIKMLRGGQLGTVEESFAGRLRPRQIFQFAGRSLEFVRIEGMTAYVRPGKKQTGAVARWMGSKMPMSSELAHAMEAILAKAPASAEMRASRRLIATQARLSDVPAPDLLLVERHKTRQGFHFVLFPFAGRAVHEGLAALLALRLGRHTPNSFEFAVNDYGLMLSSDKPITADAELLREILREDHLLQDLRESLNLAEMARRQFREIARVAGLLPPNVPGKSARSMRQLQASAGLIFDVLKQYDPGHMLLALAEREVLEQQLEFRALRACLADCAARQIRLHEPPSLTPFAFPLWAEFARGRLSTEDWKTRVERAAAKLELRHD